jgi:hypothetical protein
LIRFRSTIKIRGINPYVRVDAELARHLKKNWRKPLPVLVRIKGKPKQPWRINMMPTGDGSFYLCLHETIRNASGTKVGDRVRVELSFDRDYRGGPVHPLPRWLSAALAANPDAKSSWNALIPSRKKEILRYFASLKSPIAKVRNLTRAIEALSGKEVRFMARIGKAANSVGPKSGRPAKETMSRSTPNTDIFIVGVAFYAGRNPVSICCEGSVGSDGKTASLGTPLQRWNGAVSNHIRG